MAKGLFAQKQASNWFFKYGNTANFNNGKFTVGSPSSLSFPYSSFSTSMSDSSGKLLFVSDGMMVYDKNLHPMPNGVFALNENRAKFKIIKMPGSATKYYVIYSNYTRQFWTTSATAPAYDTLKYALIDMALNGGLGDVVKRNTILDTNIGHQFAIVQKANSENFWILTQKPFTDSFYTRYVDSSGISATKTVNIVGSNPRKTDYYVTGMETSWDSKKLAITTYNIYKNPDDTVVSIALYFRFIEVFSINDTTGKLTNHVRTAYKPYETDTSIYGYNVEVGRRDVPLTFSPDSRLLYLTDHQVGRNPNCIGMYQGFIDIYQYNTCYTDTALFSSHYYSAFAFNDCSTGSYGDQYFSILQMGLDKKIYYTTGNQKIMRAISNPNCIGGNANFFDSVATFSKVSYSLIPNFHYKYISNAIANNIMYSGGCFPSPQSFKITNDTITNIIWNFGDIASGVNNTSTLVHPSHQFSSPGFYTVKASLYNSYNVLIDTVSIQIKIYDPSQKLLKGLPKDTLLCDARGIKLHLPAYNGIVIVHGYNGNVFSYLRDSYVLSQNNGYEFVVGGGYYDTAIYVFELKQNGCDGCIIRDTLRIISTNKLNPSIVSNGLLCLGDSVKLISATNSGAFKLWSTGDTTEYIWVKQTGSYWLSVANTFCTVSDTINIVALPNVNFSLPNDTTLCDGQTLLLKPGLTGVTYEWQNGSKGNGFLVKQAGKYWVTIKNTNGCSKTDTINVSYITPSNVYLGSDKTICKGDSIKLQPNVSSNSYLWNTGATTPYIYVKDPNDYWVSIKTANCTVSDTIKILVEPKPNFTLGNDTSFCDGTSVTLNCNFLNATYLWNGGSITSTLNVSSAGSYWCKVTKNSCSSIDTVNVVRNLLPKFTLGNDTTYCGHDSILLHNTTPNIKEYTWQNASTQNSYWVKNSGIYWLELKDNKGCSFRDSITLGLSQLPVFTLGKDTAFCDGETIAINIPLSNANYLWNNGDTTKTLLVKQEGLYWALVKQNGCSKSDSIYITKKVKPIIFLGNDTTLCENNKLVLDAKNYGAKYFWNTGDTIQKIEITKPNIYVVNVSNGVCVTTDTIKVEFDIIPKILNLRDTFVCKNRFITLVPMINTLNAIFNWNTGNTTAQQVITNSGIYKLVISNSCGIDSRIIRIDEKDCLINIPNAFSPNGDGVNDIWDITSLSAYKKVEVAVYDRYGRKVFESLGNIKPWNGQFSNSGALVPTGTYYYIINTNDVAHKIVTGTVTILK